MPVFERVYAADPAVMMATVTQYRTALADAIAAGDDAARLDLLGKVGDAERMLNDLTAAIPHLQEAFAFAVARGDVRREIANAVRLATGLQYAGEYPEAETRFRHCLARIEETGERSREDFAYQHFGRCLM